MKKLLVLGGAGLIGSEVVKDLAISSSFDEVTVGDYNFDKVSEIVENLDDKRFSPVAINVDDKKRLIEIIRKHDLVCNCLPFKYDTYITKCCYEAKVPGIDLGATKDQLEMHEDFINENLNFVVCCGITPGVTNILTGFVAEQYEKIKEVNIGFASYRAIATAPGLVRTTLWEVDPNEKGRMYYDNGSFVEVPPFAGGKVINFPEPIGPQEAYHVPHNEVYTIPRSYPEVEKVTVRGTWTPKTKRLLKFLYDYGFYTTGKIEVEGVEVHPIDFMEKFIFANEDLAKDDIWGFGLVVDIKANKNNDSENISFYTTHPPANEWGGIPAVYVKNTALAMSVGVQLLADGVKRKGILTPEQAFSPSRFMKELNKRGLTIHERNGRFGLPK